MRTPETLAQNKPDTPQHTKLSLLGHLDLLDPVTWIVGIPGFISVAVASGGLKLDWQTLGIIIIGFILIGSLTIGFSQSFNEPTRPIPAGLGCNLMTWIVGNLDFGKILCLV